MSIQLNVNVVTVSGATATVKGAAPSPTNDDFIKGSSGQDVISAGDGNDRVWAGAGADYVDGGAGDDVLYGEAGDDILKGGQGNDRLDGGADADIIFGDEGNDWIWGGSGNDITYGGVGNDYLWGGVGSDLMYGDDGNDQMWGEAGDDVMFGGAGNDLLNGGAGNDALTAGAGRDTFQYWINNAERGLNFGALWGNDRITDFASGPSGDLIDMRTLFERFSDADVQKILTIVDSLVNESTGQYNNINLDLPGVTFKLGSGVSAVAELTTLGGDQVSFSFVAQDVNGVKDVQIGIKNLSVVGDAGATIKLEGSGNLQAVDFIRETMKAVHGTNGSDTYNSASFDFAGSKGVKLYGFGGDDVLDMGASSKRVEFFGGEGSDSVSGGSAGDWLQGDNGDDVIYGFGGGDALHGGNGADIVPCHPRLDRFGAFHPCGGNACDRKGRVFGRLPHPRMVGDLPRQHRRIHSRIRHLLSGLDGAGDHYSDPRGNSHPRLFNSHSSACCHLLHRYHHVCQYRTSISRGQNKT